MLPVICLCASFKVVLTSQIQTPPANPKKIIFNPREDITLYVGYFVAAEIEFGLRKFQDIRIWKQNSNPVRRIIGSWEGDINLLKSVPTSVSIRDTNQSTYNVRQDIFEVLNKIENSDQRIRINRVDKHNSDFHLFRFAEILLNRNDSIMVKFLPSGWRQLIREDVYNTGLDPKSANLARAFVWAIDSYADTPEAQLVLSLRMIREDPSNPIAWWYIATLENGILQPNINFDWQRQLETIQKRMGKWEIGKKTLAKRFKESL